MVVFQILFRLRTAKYCDEIFGKNSLFPVHNFIRHYKEGKDQPDEDKSTIQERASSIMIFYISFNNDSDEYDFFDAD